MQEIAYQELVIVCEKCRTVKKMPIQKYDEGLDLFRRFLCPNGCGPNLYSFFTVGQVKK
jgi:hypothetical protein